MEHKAIITITSHDDNNGVEVSLDWSPGLDEFDPRELGYMPASFQFLERHILPILEQAMAHSEHPEIFEDSPSDKVH